ncbi:unnamed protein product [Oppiella nova]|uniref:Uncharacterized protein n=1 Tax=Oppiella nova TaxID=334625 RepID=A0A7R9MJG0_9ACAR|nr:unnamed protein product [Oppiella nova]CAG2178514.1 unnamed protein product [Oppiella nova]
MNAYVNSIQHLFSGESVDNSYVLGKLYMFINVCENMDYSSAMDAVTYLDRYCQYNQVHGFPIEIN